MRGHGKPADEAALQFGIWAHKGSPIFAGSEEQQATAARYAAKAYLKQLERLDLVLDETGGPFLTGVDISIADCIAMATVQFAADGYGVALPARLGHLSEWYALMPEAVRGLPGLSRAVSRARLRTSESWARLVTR
ncbi:glutathione S-transferase family protein [Vreelandella sp. EE7]